MPGTAHRDQPRSAHADARRNATIYDIAREANVSHQSVSRFMRGLAMREGTKAKIEKALETLDYKPNLTARALTTGRSHRIGALTHEMHQVGPSLIVQGATSAAREAGYLLDVVTLDMGDVDEIDESLELLMQYDLDGILAFASTDSTRSVFERTRFDVPVVIASETDEPSTAESSVAAAEGIDALVDHLAALGHRSFLHIAGPEDWAAARNRLHALETALRTRDLRLAGIVHGDWSARSGFEAIEQLATDGIPTAIVAANDQMALGAMHALHARGLRVPEDVSITGVDDTPEAAYFTPSLTTVHLDFRAQGRASLRRLLDKLGVSSDSWEQTTQPESQQLVLRDSTGPAGRSSGP